MSIFETACSPLTPQNKRQLRLQLGAIAKGIDSATIDTAYIYCCFAMAQQLIHIKEGLKIAAINNKSQRHIFLELPLITSPRQVRRIRKSPINVEPVALSLPDQQQPIHDSLCTMLGATAGDFAIASVSLMQWIIAQQNKGLLLGAIDPKTKNYIFQFQTMPPPRSSIS